MDRFVGSELERHLAAYQKRPTGTSSDTSKTVMHLALNKYMEDQSESEKIGKMDPVFKSYAISQMKVFVLAGHDTISSTLCYVFHLLAKHPRTLQRVRAEHDEVFGSDLTKTHRTVTEDPHRLNRIPYTTAVIKETLRLFSPASSTRDGEPGFAVTEDGRQYPTDGFLVWSMHQAIHREPLYWPQPDTFIPERWLASEDDPLYPVKGAWRPFEFGPRNCIGQELALFEIKLVLVMTIREFDVTAEYEEWDKLNGRKDPGTVSGERAYQVLKGTTRPADGFPCRVRATSR